MVKINFHQDPPSLNTVVTCWKCLLLGNNPPPKQTQLVQVEPILLPRKSVGQDDSFSSRGYLLGVFIWLWSAPAGDICWGYSSDCDQLMAGLGCRWGCLFISTSSELFSHSLYFHRRCWLPSERDIQRLSPESSTAIMPFHVPLVKAGHRASPIQELGMDSLEDKAANLIEYFLPIWVEVPICACVLSPFSV